MIRFMLIFCTIYDSECIHQQTIEDWIIVGEKFVHLLRIVAIIGHNILECSENTLNNCEHCFRLHNVLQDCD